MCSFACPQTAARSLVCSPSESFARSLCKPDFAFYYDPGTGYVLGKQFGLPYTDRFPIPDLGVSIPLLGEIGMMAEIDTSGTLKDISVAFGIGACLGSTCDKQLDIIGSYLPIDLLTLTDIDLSAVAGNICGSG